MKRRGEIINTHCKEEGSIILKLFIEPFHLPILSITKASHFQLEIKQNDERRSVVFHQILTTVNRHDRDRKHIIKQLKIVLNKILMVVT